MKDLVTVFVLFILDLSLWIFIVSYVQYRAKKRLWNSYTGHDDKSWQYFANDG